ncbi:BMP family ABC transporter substrate-binding protein [Lawsonibacter faecis]|uniref:BMP family ABC transporter substrate-binding protein n=1 Tax=Lawsonibacter faecis TaxID=2763052 RepID=A0A8J6MDH0_9FIRM|nr:BMP family ABC transporter substrate-binding protein [Lawsonibacter faecis]MBC5738290.1 BMP family ABC transporter substrate-binding protein [Lawsonibacter faecis]
MKKHGFKKILSMLLAIGLLAAMAGCGGSGTGDGKTPAPDGAKDPDGKTKIVLLLNGYLGDLAWYDCSAAGITAIQEKYPDEVETKVIEMTTDKSKYDSIINDTLSEDWDIIVAGSWTMIEYIEAAASVSETGVIGFIGGEDSTIVNDSLVGYLEGAAYVNPDIKAIVSYTGNWDDSAKGKELALVQYNAGADVVFQLASNAGVGVFEAAKETGKLAIGSDTDQSAIFTGSDPDKAAAILTSSLKRVDTSLLHAYELYKAGTVPYGTCEQLGLDKECVGIVENDNFSAHVSAEQAAKIAQAKQDIIDGKITVSSAYGMSTEEISAFKSQFIK